MTAPQLGTRYSMKEDHPALPMPYAVATTIAAMPVASAVWPRDPIAPVASPAPIKPTTSANRLTGSVTSLREAQRKLHKVLLLDRENESLLLRCTLSDGGLPASSLRVGAGQLAKTCGQHTN